MSLVPPIRILTVDDHPFLRAGIISVIHEVPGMSVVAEASNGQEAIAAHRTTSPDVTLMDLQLPDLSGIEALIAIRQHNPDARIIVLTTFEGHSLARRVLKAGAEGYLLKKMIRKELIEAIRTVHAGYRYIPAEIAMDLAEHMQEQDLTVREIEVLRAVSAGSSNRMIASQLYISEETVKGHIKNILHKLDASDRTHAVTLATTRGLFM